MKRPLASAAIAFAIGIFLAGAGYIGAPTAAVLFVVAIGIFAAARWDARFQLPGLLGMFMAAGAMCFLLHTLGPPGDALFHDAREHSETLYTIEGVVRDAPIISENTDYARVLVDVDQMERPGAQKTIEGGLALRWSEPAFPVLPGERIRMRGFVETRLGPVNFGTAGIEEHFRRHDIHTQMRAKGDQVARIGTNRWSPRYWASRLRAWEAGILARAVPERTLPFVLAVWLGDRSGLEHARYQHFIDTGTAHILAVSGVHCGLIFMSVVFLLRIAGHRPKIWGLLAVLAVFAFALAAGARVSSLRAAFMLAIYLSAELVDREPDSPTALGIAGMVFLIFNPEWLFDTAFLLSFGSVASILLFVPLIQRGFSGGPEALRGAAATALGVQIVPLPIAAAAFYIIPLLSPLVNILVVPLLTVVLWLCLLTVFFGAVAPPVAPLFGHALVPLVAAIELPLRWLAEARIGRLVVPSPPWSALAAYALTAGLLWAALRQQMYRAYIATAAGIMLVLTGFLWTQRPLSPGVDFLDVGHGDAAFVSTSGGTTLLIDGGDKSEYTDYGSRVVTPFLLAHGVTKLDYIVATHPDRDHIGGLFHVLDNLRVGQVILGPRNHDNTLEEALLATCDERGIPVQRLARGDRLEADGAEISVLHPAAAYAAKPDVNNDSLVLRVAWDGVSVLFGGDVEAEAERELLDIPMDATVLKVPHHGSDTSSTAAFLDHVAPAAAVVSTGHKSGRRPVGVGVMERYDERGIETYRTDLEGGIRLRIDNGATYLESARATKGMLLTATQQ